jgi:hypothetical protein
MTTLTNPLKKNLCEDMQRLTAGEGSLRKTLTVSKQDRFITESDFKLMLSFMMKELKEEYRNLKS